MNKNVIAVVLAWKLLQTAALYLVFSRASVDHDYPHFVDLAEGVSGKEVLSGAEDSFLRRLTVGDGQYYLDVSRQGYRFEEERCVSTPSSRSTHCCCAHSTS